METYDLCVVGAGMIGSAAARHASVNSKLKMCLIGPEEIPYDKWKELQIETFGAHYDEGRITRTFDNDDHLRILGVKSIARYRELENLSGVSFYRDVGCLYMGTNNDSFIKCVQDGMKEGRFHYQDLSETSVFKAKFPFMRKYDDEIAFLDEDGAGHISPRKMVHAQQVVAMKQGCHLVPEVVITIEEHEKDQETLLKLTTENGKQIFAKKALLCTNAFTNFKKLLPKDIDLSINPETVAMLKLDESEAQRLRTMPCMIYHRKTQETTIMTYILPPIKYPDGNWYAKLGYSGFCPDTFNSSGAVKDWYLSKGTVDAMNDLAETLQQILPGLKVKEIDRNSCVTCNTPSGLPYIDSVTDKITVAVGGNGKGAKWSDEVGRIAARLATTGEWDSETPRSEFQIRWKS